MLRYSDLAVFKMAAAAILNYEKSNFSLRLRFIWSICLTVPNLLTIDKTCFQDMTICRFYRVATPVWYRNGLT